jgi:integrase/recombinase XerD
VPPAWLNLFQARRPDIECIARDLEVRGPARATVTRRLCTVAGSYEYTVDEELLEHSPTAHVHSPRLDDESHAPADRAIDPHPVAVHRYLAIHAV